MQGFINFANDVATALTFLIPALCYLIGVACFIYAGYGAWQCAKPGTYWASHRYLIVLELLVGSILLSFDKFLNEASNSFGGGATAAMAAGATSYTPPVINGATLIGNSPEQTLFNLIGDFRYFFIAYGAFICLLAVLAIRAVGQGKRRHGFSLPVIMLVFGVVLMNIQTIAQTTMNYFNT